MNQRLRPLTLRVAFVCALLAALFDASPVINAQTQLPARPFRISYRLSMTRPESHQFEVRIDVDGLYKDDYIDFQMPRWSPGRYGVFEFAKNVQEVKAAGGCPPQTECERKEIAVERMDTQTWRVNSLGRTGVSFTYKVFADDLSGTFSQLDSRHANYNGASVFMYVAGHKQDPVSLTIAPPAGWRVVNGYTVRPDQREWQFPNYDVLMDTPTEIAPDWTADEFRVGGKLYRVIVHSFGSEGGMRAAFVRDIEKIVRAEVALMGAPEFDSYTFLIHFDPTASRGDGMEHLTSTQIIQTTALAEEGRYEATLSTAAHEFFHVWNTKRLRPAGLGPWDFTAPVATRGLWIAEGFTNYYGNMTMHRAGIWSEKKFLEECAETITGVENAPGSRLMSAEESSVAASLLDRAVHAQRNNLASTTISYYTKGEVLGLVLDLLIRGRSRGRASLDDVMRRAYEEFYLRGAKDSYYLRGRGYTNEEFMRLASEVAGTDLMDFYTRYVRGTEVPPYEEAFAYVGLRLVRAINETEPFTAGIRTENGVVSAVMTNSAAERAGLRHGDTLISIGKADASGSDWRRALNTFKPGERVPLTVRRASKIVNLSLTLGEPDNFIYRIEETKNAPAESRALRAAWLGGANMKR